ncbi:MAG: hypothetical protein ACUVUC_14645 [Thermoguttaceae bacterium]
MRLWAGLGACLVATAVPLAAAEPFPQESAVPTIITRQTFFSIPFRVQPGGPGGQEAVEVLLYISTDRGATWRPYSRAEPQQGHFQFRAGPDGEYWFSIRTVDRSGRARPDGPLQPGLKVVVDTTPPQLELQAWQPDAGQVSARWQIADPNLGAKPLVLQYRASPYEPWQTVALEPQAPGGSGPVETGQASWSAPPAFQRLEVRAEAADKAGNTAVSHAQVSPGSVSTSPGGLELTAPATRAADGQSAPGGPPSGNAGVQPVEASGAGSVAIRIRPVYSSRYVGPEAHGDNTPQEALAAGRQLRMVNSLELELDYQLEPTDGSAVILWGTRDGGRTWQNLGLDRDRRSPFLVTVPEQGLYGFRLDVLDDERSIPQAPSPGAPAELWVGVDLTQPQARIVAVQPLAGQPAGPLAIRWEADDWMLGPGPVSLGYGPGHQGPWTTIAAGLENTGELLWWPDSRAPPEVFIRLEVRDAAGNASVRVTPKPIRLDPRRLPRRLTDARPAGR